jgi:hypothetical protein
VKSHMGEVSGGDLSSSLGLFGLAAPGVVAGPVYYLCFLRGPLFFNKPLLMLLQIFISSSLRSVDCKID